MDNIDLFLQQSNYIEGEYSIEAFEDAKKAWEYLMSQDVLTLDVICKTHKILMKSRPLQNIYKGHLRDIPVYIGGREAMSYRLVPGALLNWCFESMRASPKVDPISLHIRFEKIHPFVDGNGRIGRMLLNWTRIKRNKEGILVINEQDRQEYYKWFNDK